jgi:hypothetical protein
LPKLSLWSLRGLNSNSPVSISKVMQARDHMSALRLYLDPVRTSGPRYCRVWISVAKWWCYQQAFPRSAIFTLNPFYSLGPLSRISLVRKAEKRSLTDFFSRCCLGLDCAWAGYAFSYFFSGFSTAS